jgi:predicted site-specific integrase-resolvase
MSLHTPSAAARIFGVTTQTLRAWHRKGIIEAVQEDSGHRRYLVNENPQRSPRPERERIVYARVSSKKQSGDLERQIAALQQARPGYRVISDIGSGLNYKRRGLLEILDLAIAGRLEELVVAYKDRLVRFGYEFIEHVLQKNGAILTVLHPPDMQGNSNEAELAEDLLSIVTVFAARHHGSRKGRGGRDENMPQDPNLSEQGTGDVIQ